MLTVIAILFLLIVLDIAAMRWGFTSSDGLESKEWERRQQRVWPQEYVEARVAKRQSGMTVLAIYNGQATGSRKVRTSPEMAPQC
jgi:hypothetical protein